MSDDSMTTTTTTRRTRDRFGLEWWGAIPVLGFIVLQIVMSPPFRSDADVSQLGGRIIGGLLIACLFGWIVYVFASYSRHGATVAFSCLLVVVSLSNLPRPDSRSDASAAQAVEAQVMQEMTGARQHYERIVANFAGAGGLEAASMATRADVEERLALLQNVITANEKLTRSAVGVPDRVDGLLRGRGVSERGIAESMDALRRQFPLDKVLAMRRAEGQVCEAMRAELAFMRDHFGKWAYDTASASIVHDTDALREQHAALQAGVQAAVREQQRVTEAAASQTKGGPPGATAP